MVLFFFCLFFAIVCVSAHTRVYTCMHTHIYCIHVVNKNVLSLSLQLFLSYLKLENNARLLAVFAYWKAINIYEMH